MDTSFEERHLNSRLTEQPQGNRDQTLAASMLALASSGSVSNDNSEVLRGMEGKGPDRSKHIDPNTAPAKKKEQKTKIMTKTDWLHRHHSFQTGPYLWKNDHEEKSKPPEQPKPDALRLDGRVHDWVLRKNRQDAGPLVRTAREAYRASVEKHDSYI